MTTFIPDKIDFRSRNTIREKKKRRNIIRLWLRRGADYKGD